MDALACDVWFAWRLTALGLLYPPDSSRQSCLRVASGLHTTKLKTRYCNQHGLRVSISMIQYESVSVQLLQLPNKLFVFCREAAVDMFVVHVQRLGGSRSDLRHRRFKTSCSICRRCLITLISACCSRLLLLAFEAAFTLKRLFILHGHRRGGIHHRCSTGRLGSLADSRDFP